jgi:FkbM family methyltransferase
MINILFFVLYVITNPKLWLPLIHGNYLPVYLQYSWLTEWNIKTFIDIGAHKGTVSKTIISLSPEVKIYAFEPIESFATEIKKSLANVEVINAAVGEKEGTVTFHKTDYTPASSVRPFTKNFDNKFAVSEDIQAKVVTLDNYFSDKKLQHPVVLKIDVQGYEREVLNGAKIFLKQVDIIHIESNLIEVYSGQALFGELHQMLTSAGFVYKGASADGEFIPKFAPQESQNSVYFRS